MPWCVFKIFFPLINQFVHIKPVILWILIAVFVFLFPAAVAMAATDVSVQDMSDVVIVTIPETAGGELPGVVEEDKAVLVTTELTPEAGYQR